MITPMRRLIACFLAVTALTGVLPAAADRGEVDYAFMPLPGHAAEPARPLPKYQFLYGDAARWPDALRWRYNPANAPSQFADVGAAVDHIARTLDIWARSCGIRHVYEGVTATPPNQRINAQPDYENVVGWGTLDGQVAGVTYAWYRPLASGRELVDADIILSPDRVTGTSSMERTAKHEWGHALGLAHSDFAGMLMSGPPDTSYNNLTSLQWDDVRGCRCLYGASASEPAGYACGVPRSVDLGAVAVGTTSAPRAVVVANAGNAALAINDRSTTAASVGAAGCEPGSSIPPGGRCTLSITARPPAAGAFGADVLLTTSDGPYLVGVRFEGGSAPPLQGPALIEYFHAGFGHYFVTSIAGEIAALDGGAIAGWSRTGLSIPVHTQASAQSVPVCRFFSAAFAPRSSHFYTASSAECDALKGSRDWQFEGEVFHVGVPDAAGRCAAGTQPVYRLYNDGASGAPNHRFTLDPAVRAAMLAQGWLPEGAGEGVTMCARL